MLVRKYETSVPFLLIYSRILLGILIPSILIFGTSSYVGLISASLIFIGLLTDVFDGIIARRMGISSERLRVWDSNVDQFFWLAIIGTVFYLNLLSIIPHLFLICIIVILEALAYFVSFMKFKKVIATHSILAKIWTISLLVWIIELILFGTDRSFLICFWLGLISRLEIIGIILILKHWATDIPSVLVVGKINRGEAVKKSIWFNG